MEEKVANTILEKESRVEINKTGYHVKPSSVATLIEVSRLISKMPYVDGDVENIFTETLRTARDCKVLGDIVATMVVGIRPKNWFNRLFYISSQEAKIKKLSNEVLQLTPKALNKLISKLLLFLEISDFFGLTISLSEINLLKPTKEVGKMTASGPQ